MMAILYIEYNLLQLCFTALKPTETNGDISDPDWIGYALVLELSIADCYSRHGLPYAINAQGRL